MQNNLVGNIAFDSQFLTFFMRTLKFIRGVVAVFFMFLVVMKQLDAKETMGDIQSQDAIKAQETIDSPITGHGFTVPLGLHYSHLRGYYGNVGLLSGDIIGEGSERVVKGVLIDASLGKNDYGISLGVAGASMVFPVVGLAAKATMLVGKSPDKDYFLTDGQKAYGLELSIAYFAGLSVGVFREEGTGEIKYNLATGIGF